MANQVAAIHEADTTSEWIDEALGSTLTEEQQMLLVAQVQDLINKFQVMQILIVVEYFFMCSMSFALVCYLRRNRHIALKGDATAARKLMLPAFEPLLWLLGFTTGTYALLMLFSLLFGWFNETLPIMLLEVFYSVKLFVYTLAMVFLLQKSVSFPALRRSVVLTFIMSTYTMLAQLPISEYVQPSSPRLAFGIMSAVRALVLGLFAYVAVRPPARASKRTLREYCAFVFTHFVLQFISGLCFYMDALDAGFVLSYVTALWAVSYPVIVWRVLRADTEFWRGMGQRAVDLQTLFRQKHSIDERISSQGLHVLIEMHRKLIIDFAHLELQHKIGVGASAVVFNGMLHPTTPVAVKVYTPVAFTEETVAAFSHEAALCGALHHPNIVKFFGMCVYPPTICLVSELCHGTLGDVTCATRISGQRSRNRQQMLLNISYMVDAARAVAYLHSFSPPFLHRDIKPANFLVDSCGAVKLTDFGESRSLARSKTVPPPSGDLERLDSANYSAVSTSSVPSDTQSSQSQLQPQQPIAPQMTVKGTVDYMAPELIQGRAGLASYAEAADVYSLAMTMWDVLHPDTEKYPTLKNNHLQVFAFVVEGKRPKLDLDKDEGELHSALREVIKAAWDADPCERPSAAAIVTVLEGIQEELFAVFASELLPELRHDISVATASNKPRAVGGATPTELFPGELIATRMQDMRYVQCAPEAIRLGNAFMDAGLLHHQKHTHAFENARTAYFFDEDNIRLCQPFGGSKRSIVLELDGSLADGLLPQQDQCRAGGSTNLSLPWRGSSGCTLSEDQASLQNNLAGSTLLTSGSGTTRFDFQRRTGGSAGTPSAGGGVNGNGVCRCRKLGQRLELPRAPRGRRLRRKFKPTAVDDNVLTARLLEADASLIAAPDLELGPVLGDTLDGFDAVGQNVRAA